MFFIKAETQGFGFFVAGKPCAGGMVEENLRLFSISLFVVSFSSFFRSFPLSRFALPLFFVFLSLSLSFLSVLLFPALSAFPALLSLFYFSFFFPFLFPFFLPFFFRSFPLSRFAFPLFSFLFLFPFFLSFFFPSFPSFPLCSLRIKFLCYCKKYGPAAVLMNTQYGTRKYHRPEILQKGVLGQTSSGNRSYT